MSVSAGTLAPRASSAGALLRSHFAAVSIEEPSQEELRTIVSTRFPKLAPLSERLVTTFTQLQGRDVVRTRVDQEGGREQGTVDN